MLLFLVGLTGSLIFQFLRLPMPALLGSMSIFILLRVFEQPVPEEPWFLFPLLQILLGLHLGTRIKGSIFKDLKQLFLPAAFIGIWVVFTPIALGLALPRISSISFYTALLGSIPGGIAESGVIALAVGADVSVVMLFQALRIFIFTFVFSTLVVPTRGKMVRGHSRFPGLGAQVWSKVVEYHRLAGQISSSLSGIPESVKQYPWNRAFISFVFAFAGGLLGRSTGLPAGELFGSMFFMVGAILLNVRLYTPPPGFHRTIQLGVGAVIGLSFSRQVIANLAASYHVAILVLIALLGSSIIVALAIRRATGWSKPLSILVASPAGITSTTVMAECANCDIGKISVLHLYRILLIKIMIVLLLQFA